MNNVTMICQPPIIFTIDDANALIPVITRITERHQSKVEDLLARQRYFMKCGATTKIKEIDDLVGREYVVWGAKLMKLGVTSLINGFVGFDFGCGYWSWCIMDGPKIGYYHGYNDAPHSRRELSYVTGPVL